MMDKLSGSIKGLVNRGVWCCYKTKQGEFIIGTTPYSPCCNPHGKQTIYLASPDGSELTQTDKKLEDFEIEHPVSFPEAREEPMDFMGVKIPL